jgi:hypothetical protein
MVARRQLVEMIGMECNRQRTARSPEALKGIARTLKAVQAALAAIDREIDDKLSGSPAWRVAKDLLTSIPAIRTLFRNENPAAAMGGRPSAAAGRGGSWGSPGAFKGGKPSPP